MNVWKRGRVRKWSVCSICALVYLSDYVQIKHIWNRILNGRAFRQGDMCICFGRKRIWLVDALKRLHWNLSYTCSWCLPSQHRSTHVDIYFYELMSLPRRNGDRKVNTVHISQSVFDHLKTRLSPINIAKNTWSKSWKHEENKDFSSPTAKPLIFFIHSS